MEDKFFLDPLENEKIYLEEQMYHEYIQKLPGKGEYQFANGRVEFLPKLPLIVGCCYDIEIKYFPEVQELKIGTKIAFSIPRTWTPPQSHDVLDLGFVSAGRSNEASCKLGITHNENLQWWITVEIADNTEPKEGFVGITYNNVVVQRFPQHWFGNWRSAMRTVIYSPAKKDYLSVRAARTEKPKIRRLPDEPGRLDDDRAPGTLFRFECDGSPGCRDLL